MARLDMIFMLLSGLYSNIRGFLIFLVIGCQNNVKAEIWNIFRKILPQKKEVILTDDETIIKNRIII